MTALERTEAALRRLLADLQADLEVLEAIATRLDSAPIASDSPSDAPARALVAIELHHYYTALEGTFERVARLVDGHLPSGEGWHRELLRQVSLPVPGVRDPLFDPPIAVELSHLLSFRHFFRHAYAVELDSRRLAEHRERVSRVHPEVVLGLKRLHAHLEATLEKLETSTRDDG